MKPLVFPFRAVEATLLLLLLLCEICLYNNKRNVHSRPEWTLVECKNMIIIAEAASFYSLVYPLVHSMDKAIEAATGKCCVIRAAKDHISSESEPNKAKNCSLGAENKGLQFN